VSSCHVLRPDCGRGDGGGGGGGGGVLMAVGLQVPSKSWSAGMLHVDDGTNSARPPGQTVNARGWAVGDDDVWIPIATGASSD